MSNPRISGSVLTATGTGAIGIAVQGDTDIDHVSSITATTSIQVGAGATATVYGAQFDPTTISEIGTGVVESGIGDRSAWDALDYQARHTNDINDASGIHHTLAALDTIYLHKDLTEHHIFVGDASNEAADVAMSGDVTIISDGTTTIGAKKVTDDKIELADTKLLIGGADGAAHEQNMSADATIANTGALTLATVNANVGTFGDEDHVAQVTVNAKGLVTAIVEIVIATKEVLMADGITPPDPLTTEDETDWLYEG